MKTTIPAVLLLVFLISFCIITACCVTNKIDQTTKYLEKCMEHQYAGNQEAAAVAAKEAEKIWYQEKPLLCILLNHQEINSVQADFSRLNEMIIEKECDEDISTCAGLLSQLQNIRDIQWPSFKNIM